MQFGRETRTVLSAPVGDDDALVVAVQGGTAALGGLPINAHDDASA